MAELEPSAPTRRHLPIVLIRGFGGLDVEEEQALAYQGFNVGSVYPHKRGENYIYEGMILRLLKGRRRYHDATNVIGYFDHPVREAHAPRDPLTSLDPAHFSGDRIVIDPEMARRLLETDEDPFRSIWVFRYYDLGEREFAAYGRALVRLIELIRSLLTLGGDTGAPRRVNVIAHSMGGLIVREAIQVAYPERGLDPAGSINKVVTLGTPHKGISFQVVKDFRWLRLDAEQELERFNPERQASEDNPASWTRFGEHFPVHRLLTVVGTNYRDYGLRGAAWANRMFPVDGEYGRSYNRSDGLVKQAFAQIDGAPRTFVHKCHGGVDSLVTSREAFEIATRFFSGNFRARLRMVRGEVRRGRDWFGKSEFFFGVSIKPRGVDFDLFHQSKEAENCYGPFHTLDFSDQGVAFDWAGPDRLIWEGHLDVDLERQRDLVIRLDFYVGERDVFGVGFSDNVVFRKQYYLRAEVEDGLVLRLFTGEEFNDPLAERPPLELEGGGWRFDVAGTGFDGTFQVELERVPVDGGMP